MRRRLAGLPDDGAVVADSKGRQWFARARWLEIDGRTECVGIELWKGVRPSEDGSAVLGLTGDRVAPITSADLKDIPVATVLRTLWAVQSRRLEGIAGSAEAAAGRRARRSASWGLDAEDEITKRLHAHADGLREQVRRGKRREGTEHLSAVATIYREAEAARRNPTKTVADAFACAPSTAARWVGQARKAGLLPTTTRGSRKGK